MKSPHIGPLTKALAAICRHCPICNHGRSHPDSLLGRLLHHPFHADHCALWKAERDVRAERPETVG